MKRTQAIELPEEEIAKQKEWMAAFAALEDRPHTYCVVTYGCQMNAHDSEKLEGMLTRLSAYSNLSKRKIDLNLTKECLQNLITPNEPVVITGERIQEKVAEYYQMRVEDFKAKKRTKNIAFPRQVAMYLCREMTDLSLPKIGELFGGRDHTTVIHACEKISEELRNDQTLQMTINKIKNSLTE